MPTAQNGQTHSSNSSFKVLTALMDFKHNISKFMLVRSGKCFQLNIMAIDKFSTKILRILIGPNLHDKLDKIPLIM